MGFIMHFRYRKMIFLLLAYLINNNLALADNKNIEFDIDSLKSLGYGSEIADYFKEGSHFLPGYHDVTIIVNSSLNYSDNILDRKSTRLNSSHIQKSRMPSSA